MLLTCNKRLLISAQMHLFIVKLWTFGYVAIASVSKAAAVAEQREKMAGTGVLCALTLTLFFGASTGQCNSILQLI